MVAIDDITAQHGPCQQADPNVFRCTFEGGHNCSFTPVYDIENLQMFWNVSKGSETSLQIIDHTLKTKLGHFYTLDIFKMKNASTVTNFNYKILSKYFPPTRQACVTFSYFMEDQEENKSFSFYIMKEDSIIEKRLWKAKGDLGPFWYSHRMTIDSGIKWRIGFDVTAPYSTAGFIAIDDIIVEIDKPCPPKGKCDFEVKTNYCSV